MFLTTIKQFFQNNKKVFYYIWFFAIIFLISGDSVFAETWLTIDTKNTIATIIEGMLSWFALILALFTYLISLFLDPSWLNGSFFGLTDKFKSIWILVSNVVYFIFAFLLIWIAFMNIIWKEWENYQLKQAIPKFIIWVLIVPFSWFLVQFVLSISAILTVSALSLPADTFPQFEKWINGIEVYTDCEIFLNSEKKKENGWFIKCNNDSKKKLWDVFAWGEASTSIFWLVYVYTNSIMSLEEMWKVNHKSIVDNISTVLDLVVKIVIDLLFVVIYSILMIALWLILLVRWIYLWLYMMMSPVFGLMYFFGKNDGGWDGFFSKFNIKEFISLALVPVYTMLALSFWLLFLYVVGTWMSWNTTSPDKNVGTWLSGNGIHIDKEGIKLWTWEDQFKLKITWSLSNSDQGNIMSVWQFFADIKDWSLGVIWSLIVQFFGIVVLWWAMMAAMRSSEITKAIVEPIHAFGNQVWGLIAKSPQYAPIFGGQSMTSMQQIASSAQNYYWSTKPSESARSFMKDHWLFGNESSSIDAKDIKSKLAVNEWSSISKAVQSWVKNAGKAVVASQKTELIDSLLAVAEKLNIKEFKDKKISDIKWNAQEYVNLVAAIDHEIALTKVGSWAVDIIPDNGATKNNLAPSEFDTLMESVNWNSWSSDSSRKIKEIWIKEWEWNSVHIEVGSVSYNINRDDSRNITNDVDKKQLIDQTVKALNEWYSKDQIKMMISQFANWQDTIQGNIWHNKKTGHYGVQKPDTWWEDYKKVDNVDDLFKK